MQYKYQIFEFIIRYKVDTKFTEKLFWQYLGLHFHYTEKIRFVKKIEIMPEATQLLNLPLKLTQL